jgi:hypothetical protein
MDDPSRRMDEGNGIPRLMHDRKKWDAEFPFMNRTVPAQLLHRLSLQLL